MALFLALFLGASLLYSARAHGDHKENAAQCRGPASNLAVVSAEYIPGKITVDGAAADWDAVEGIQFSLYPALDPASGDPYPGKMTVKAAHDGRDLFFLLKIPGSYQYKQSVKRASPSVALMFPIGDDATYVDMGGCSESLNCSKQSCGGHEVDIMHFSISDAVPGRSYGANLADNLNGTGRDSTGSLHDLYAWNPHCRYYDGIGPNGPEANGGAQNDWKGVWSHTSIENQYGLTTADSPYGASASAGSYIFEFSRPLQTSDRLQQDAQFSIGKSYRFASAFWFPVNNVEWSPMQHFSMNCEWTPLRIVAAENERAESAILATSISTFSLVFAVGSMLVSAAIAWWVKTNKQGRFTPISDTL
ncbi:hypothetical protein SELMODRAFT_440403 [Selaginella moellendorffii]|uniref:Cytochrome c-552/DMSO reductase-like haem-binding domain-containing protein n=1 Tax=Selaginella moellendorffii TaxID=88036 RepID=D8RBJ0_SELML|nr:uncharacterized protein LOC9631424 [Selaginella moellendorffii]EFJ30806.1 hypothetical protein SELMODRAFT_440403 [Selaginella moellendorffii]|eukprot:XP_002968552.1 uncharacterized protein LOC9631424 [Selaginella moellendorffii]